MAYGVWSLESNPQIQNGDRVFFLQSGATPCGIMASGHTRSACVQGDHPFEADNSAWHMKLRFDTILDANVRPILEIQDFEEKGMSGTDRQEETDGMLIPPGIAAELEAAWREFLANHEAAEREKQLKPRSEGGVILAGAGGRTVFLHGPVTWRKGFGHLCPALFHQDLDPLLHLVELFRAELDQTLALLETRNHLLQRQPAFLHLAHDLFQPRHGGFKGNRFRILGNAVLQ